MVNVDETKSQNDFIGNQENISENFKEQDDTDFVKGLSHFDKGCKNDST